MSKKQWIVTMRCTVTKEVIVTECTEEQAKENPYDCEVIEERETDQSDFDVLSVEENK